MKYFRRFFLLMLSITSYLLHSQTTNYTIKAVVYDQHNNPVEFGNALVLSPKDSSLYKGAPFQNGEVNLPNLLRDTLILKLSSVGFEDFFVNVERLTADSLIDLGKIILKENNLLGEVTVKAKIPLFESDGEKLKVNVENTSLNSVGNALDVLRRSPGIMVSTTDVVSVLGKGAAIIYLDGLLLSSNDLLKSLPSSDIKRVEIISNPSARYDAAGKAVINIITKQNNREGVNGNIIQNTLSGKYLFTYTGLRLNMTKGKWSFYAGYGTNKGRQWNSDEYLRKYNFSDTINMEMKNKIYETQRFSNVNFYRTGLNYRLDSNSTISFQYSGFYNTQNNSSDNQNVILQNSADKYNLKTQTALRPLLINNGANLNYFKKLDTLGSEFFAAVQYGNFNSQNVSKIQQQTNAAGTTNTGLKRNSSNNNIQIAGLQIDLTKTLGKSTKLETGLKNSNISKKSDLLFENFSDNQTWVSDPAYQNGFTFSENIAAAYAELRYKKNKWNGRIGGRLEHTLSQGFSKRLNQTIIDRNYMNFFPSAFIGYDFTKDLTTSLTLSSRINRPGFQDLDPFINYIDSLTSFRGNPFLLPDYTNSIEASLIYMKEANLTVGYNTTKGAMRLVVDKLNDSTDAFTATTKNLKKSEAYSFGITIPYELKWWTTANYFGYYLNNFVYEQNNVLVQNFKPTFSIYLYNEFRFKKIASLEIVYEYTSKAVDGIFISNPFSMLNATVKRKFFNDKLTCSFMASDILSTYIMSGQSNIPVYNLAYHSLYNTHYYQLALNYKFGKLKKVNYKNKTVSDDEYSRIKMGK